MIRKVKGGYVVLSEKGKHLSKVLPSREAAAERLRQVEFFKHHGPRVKKPKPTKKRRGT